MSKLQLCFQNAGPMSSSRPSSPSLEQARTGGLSALLSSCSEDMALNSREQIYRQTKESAMIQKLVAVLRFSISFSRMFGTASLAASSVQSKLLVTVENAGLVRVQVWFPEVGLQRTWAPVRGRTRGGLNSVLPWLDATTSMSADTP